MCSPQLGSRPSGNYLHLGNFSDMPSLRTHGNRIHYIVYTVYSSRSDLRPISRSRIGEPRAAVTELAPAGARRTFPGSDERGFKARFALEVTGPADAAAVSNGPIESTETLPDGRRRWRFAETPPL